MSVCIYDIVNRSWHNVITILFTEPASLLVSSSTLALNIRYPKCRASGSGHQKEHGEGGNQLKDQGDRSEPKCDIRLRSGNGMDRHLRGILQLASTDAFLPLLLAHIKQVEVAPVVEGTGTIASQNEKHGSASHGDKDERKQNNELNDLPQRKGRIDGTGGRRAE